MARGFDRMFSQINSRDARAYLRVNITELFGSKGEYYRYKHGERLLNPEQQQHIRHLLDQCGSGHLDFDHYENNYDFNIPQNGNGRP